MAAVVVVVAVVLLLPPVLVVPLVVGVPVVVGRAFFSSSFWNVLTVLMTMINYDRTKMLKPGIILQPVSETHVLNIRAMVKT